MALLLVPYNNAMRLGQGFNSYTQEICVDNAVVGMTDPEDSQPIQPPQKLPIGPTEIPTPTASDSGGGAGGGAIVVQPKMTTVPKKDISLQTTQNVYPSQIVTYYSKYVNKLSDVTNDLNISGSLSIRYGEISGGGSGHYIDSETFQNSDMNFLISVKVVNQTINVKDQLDFWPLERDEGRKPDDIFDDAEFTKTYGDCFISGFQEGGQFTAIVSIRALDSSKKTDIGASAHLALQVGVGDVSAEGDVKMAKEELNKNSEVNITVNWSGGGQLKEGGEQWTVDTLTEVAVRFPDLVATCPQRTYAILTKYSALRGFLDWKGKNDLGPLDYELAGLYTSELLDVYMGYKNVWVDLHNLIQDLDVGAIKLHRAPDPSSAVYAPSTPKIANPETADDWEEGEELTTYEPTYNGIDAALQRCRSLMVRIVSEAEKLTKNPSLAVDTTRPIAYIRPQVFRQLLPRVPVPTVPLETSLASVEHWLDIYEGTGSDTTQDFPATPAYTQTPDVAVGLMKIDLERVSKPQLFYFGATAVQRNSVTLTQKTGNRDNWLGKSWGGYYVMVTIPVNDEGVLTGNYYMRTADVTRSASRGNPNALVSPPHRVNFAYSYNAPPTVVTWLTGFDMPTEGTVDINVQATDIDIDGFSITTSTTNATKIYGGTATWIAIPQNYTKIAAGKTSMLPAMPPPSGIDEGMSVRGHVHFDPDTFNVAPTVAIAISGFRFGVGEDDNQNVRIIVSYDAVTKYGFDWVAQTWIGSPFQAASIAWVAFAEPDLPTDENPTKQQNLQDNFPPKKEARLAAARKANSDSGPAPAEPAAEGAPAAPSAPAAEGSSGASGTPAAGGSSGASGTPAA